MDDLHCLSDGPISVDGIAEKHRLNISVLRNWRPLGRTTLFTVKFAGRSPVKSCQASDFMFPTEKNVK